MTEKVKTYFRGKDIKEMSREELIEALIVMGKLLNESTNDFQSYVNLVRDIRARR